MKKYILIAGMMAAAAFAVESQPTFDRYQVILDRKPFGEAPLPPPEPEKNITAAESFARGIRMTVMTEIEGGGLKVGFVDQPNNKNFYLMVGESVEGIELVEADYAKEEAVLRKGSEMAVLKFSATEVQPLNIQQQQQRVIRGGSRLSYAERRAARMQQRQKPPPQPPPEPLYKGEELEQHLQDYQMEVIRQGLPPLPIPLTPEMDAQLVSEGVLPPLE